jgi:hypothetical protein
MVIDTTSICRDIKIRTDAVRRKSLRRMRAQRKTAIMISDRRCVTMKWKTKTILILVVSALLIWSLPARATIFSALSDAVKDIGRVNKNVSADYGTAKIDESSAPPEVTVGETSALWRGYWQTSGGKLKIRRAEKTSLLLTSDVTSIRFRIRWIGANEAVARSANHRFWLKLFREEKDKSLTEIDESVQKVEVGKKGLGGTVYEKGYLRLPPITTETPGWYKLEMGAKNVETGAETSTCTFVHIERESPENVLNMGCDRTSEFKKYDRCWGWHKTHTYRLDKESDLTFLDLTVLAGPSERKGTKYKDWLIESSRDGKKWAKIGTMDSVVGEKTSRSFDASGQPKIRYVRVNTQGKGTVDWSSLKVWIR